MDKLNFIVALSLVNFFILLFNGLMGNNLYYLGFTTLYPLLIYIAYEVKK